MRRPSPPRSPRGFTMIELLVSLAIMATIFSLIYASYATTIQTKLAVEDGDELYGTARLALDRMSRELSMAYLRPAVRDDPANYTLFVGEDAESDGYPTDSLHFTSVSHIRLGGNVRESDQNEISYFLVERGETRDKTLLYREDPTIDEEPMAGGVLYELGNRVYGLNFRYYDSESKEWVDQWDSREIEPDKPGLPQAVEITLALRGAQDEELIFQTKVMVRQ